MPSPCSSVINPDRLWYSTPNSAAIQAPTARVERGKVAGDPGDQPGLLLVVEAAGAVFVAEARKAIDPVSLIQQTSGLDRIIVQKQNLGDRRVSHAAIQQNQSIRTARQPIGRQPVPHQLSQVTSRFIVQKTLPLHPRTRIPLAPFGKPHPNSHRIGG